MNLTIRQNRILSLFSIIGYILMVVVNWMAVSLPLYGVDTGEISDRYKNLFTPAGFTFSIWGIIYLLLAGFVIYQVFQIFRKDADLSGILKWFIISCLANAAWLVSWHSDNLILCFFLMLVLLLSLINIHNRADLALPPKPVTRKIFLDLPFSIYLGWISVALIANVSALLVKHKVEMGLTQEAWTIIMVAFASFAGIFMTWLKYNYAYALVIIWALYGILQERISDGNAGSLSTMIYLCITVLVLGIIFRVIAGRKSTPSIVK